MRAGTEYHAESGAQQQQTSQEGPLIQQRVGRSSDSNTALQGLADARKRARRSGLVQFFAVYQFDRGGILQMCHTVGELCNHAVRGSMVWRQTSDTICEFTVNSVF